MRSHGGGRLLPSGYGWIAILALFGSACAATPQAAVPADPPAKVLFVGNSFTYYNNSLHNHYRALVRASGASFKGPHRARIMTISGGHLPEHSSGLTQMLDAEKWDVVVMQGHSLGPISPGTDVAFQAAARDYASRIRARGARPVFFMTWAYTGKPEMTRQLDDAYTAIAKELDAELVPVGRAFQLVTDARPDIALRIADARHPTLAGSYLAACMFFAAFHGKSPEGLNYTAGLDDEVAAYLQRTAWQVVAAQKAG